MRKSCANLFYFSALFLFMACSSNNQDEVIVIPEEEVKIELPKVFINTNGTAIVDEPKIDATLIITNNDLVDYTGRIGIEIRGASSQMFPKKSYGFETRDESNEDISVSLLGTPEEEDWILYAPYSDKSLLRNMLIYDLSRAMGRYASRTQFVEVTIDEVYQGIYVFMEKLKRDSGRIAINNLKEDENSGDDLTGGYILKIDKTAGTNLGEGYNEMNSFTSTYIPAEATLGQQIHFLYEDPDAEDITPEQKTYITDYVGSFETALASADFADPLLGYENYIDVDSFIDFFILNELSNNVDGYRLSTYMHKDKNGKLNMGPIWDFNIAFGNADYCNGGDTNVWAYKFNERCPNDFWLVPFWWKRLLEDENYVLRLQQRWTELRAGILSNGVIEDKVDTYTTALYVNDAVATNFDIWPILGVYVWPNNFVGATYDDELNYLDNWINDRLTWMDAQINSL